MKIFQVICGVIFLSTFLLSIGGCKKNGIMSDESHGEIHSEAIESEQEILYWTCVMHPSVKMAEPGTCPVCGMDLIPVHEGAGLTLSETQKQLIPIRTEPIEFHRLTREIRTVGILDYDETKINQVSTRISGWIERLHVDFTGLKVSKNDELLSIYSPELLATQEEYLTAIRTLNSADATMENLLQTFQASVSAARSKLELYGLTPEQVNSIGAGEVVQTYIPIYAPMGGTVVHKNVHEGQYVKRGSNLYKLADLSNLWVVAEVYESELPQIYAGQHVEIETIAIPGKIFDGKISFIYPYLDRKTRTQKIQIEVENSEEKLRPGMSANLTIRSTVAEGATSTEPYACPMHPWVTAKVSGNCRICGMKLTSTASDNLSEDRQDETTWTCPMHPEVRSEDPGECPKCGMDLVEVVRNRSEQNFTQNENGEVLSVPKSAVIDTGLRKIVFVDRGEAGYEQIEIEVGSEATAELDENKRKFFPILGGLYEDDVVVTNGNFLLDSQTQLTSSASGAFGGSIGEEKSESTHRH